MSRFGPPPVGTGNPGLAGSLMRLCLLIRWPSIGRTLLRVLLLTALGSFGRLGATQEPLAKPELVLQDAHSSTVTAVAFSPDEKVLATVGLDGMLKFWDPVEGHELRSIDLREMFDEGFQYGRISAVAYSPDGRELAVAMDQRLVLSTPAGWFAITHTAQINDLVFDPEGQWIGLASSDGSVRIMDSQTLELRRSLGGHSSPLLALAVNRDGSRIVSGGLDNEVSLWDSESGRKLESLHGHTDWIRVLAFSPDGTVIASGSDDRTIRLWRADSGKLLNTLNTDAEVEGMAFTADGRSLVSGTDHGTLQIWDLDCIPSQCRDTSKPDPPGVRMRTVFGLSTPFDLAYQNLRRIEEGSGRLALSPGGRWLARGGGGVVELHQMPSLKLSRILGERMDVKVSRFSPDGRYLAAGSTTIHLWDVALGLPKRILSLPMVMRPAHADPSQVVNLPPRGGVLSLDFSPYGNMLAAGYAMGGVQLWNVYSGRKLNNLVPPSDSTPVMDVRFSADGKFLATCTGNEIFQLWDPESAKELRRFDTKQIAGNSGCTLAFGPSGNILGAGITINDIQVWDIASGRTLSSIPVIEQPMGLASNPRTGALAAVGNFGTKLWRKDLKEGPQTLYGHKAWVASASISSDGRLLATGSADNTVKIWDVDSGEENQTLVGYPVSPSFSPDSRWLASSGHGQTVLWDLDSGEKKATLISIGLNDWLVVTPEGLFDGSRAAYAAMMWRFDDSRPLDVLPVESFFNEFYRPGVLADIFNHVELSTPRPIASLDRRQPSLKLSSPGIPATGPASSRAISLQLDVEPAPAGGSFKTSSGARDVRIYRNGSMIRTFHGEVGSSTLHFRVPIVAGQNAFTAYAFNDSDIKSRNAQFRVVGADSLKRKGTAYLIAMGVNHYSNSNYDLRYAAHDASAFADELKKRLSQLDTFSDIRVVPLINDDATKANLLDALHKLGGTISVSDHARDSIRTLPTAEPEDVVFVFFAGHGTSVKSHFYLIPHDLGYQGNRDQLNETSLNTILEHSVSDGELQTAFERIDARKLVLIIDACNSGQALEADEKRRGPMNSKGLAQLAYEKGMYVLTASQSYQAALEGEKLGHGLLTYALVEEGLKTPAAETGSASGELELRDWLDYAAQRVPELQSDLKNQSRMLKHEQGNAAQELDTSSQQPRLFYRQEIDATPLIIAKIPARR
jgi:WD40 repeat protein